MAQVWMREYAWWSAPLLFQNERKKQVYIWRGEIFDSIKSYAT